MRADLHVHTYYSDGLLSPEDVVTRAEGRGVDLIAVTDHDTAAGCAEVKSLCGKNGLKAVYGIEVSAYFGNIKIHTLCYNPDTENTGFKAFLKELYDGSFTRTEEILFKLKGCGVNLTLQEVLSQRKSEDIPIHAMHIARAAAEKGYGKAPYDFYDKYLMTGRPAFTALCRPSPERTVEIIGSAGGVSSLAHPARIVMNADEKRAFIKRLVSCGLDGIEAVYSTHTDRETAYYKELAGEFGLLVTGGSDTHFADGRNKIGLPYFEPDARLLHKLKI